MAQRTNYLQIFLQVYPGVRILLGFRVGINKPCRAKLDERSISAMSRTVFFKQNQAFRPSITEFESSMPKSSLLSCILELSIIFLRFPTNFKNRL